MYKWCNPPLVKGRREVRINEGRTDIPNYTIYSLPPLYKLEYDQIRVCESVHETTTGQVTQVTHQDTFTSEIIDPVNFCKLMFDWKLTLTCWIKVLNSLHCTSMQ